MKKLTVTYSSKLQAEIARTEGRHQWRNLPLMAHVYGLIAHVHQIAMTGEISKPSVPVITPGHSHYTLLGDHLPTSEEDLANLSQVYHSSKRIEVQVFTGLVEVCLGVNILFYGKGKNNVPLLILEGALDSDGIRYLRVKQ